MRTYVPVFLCLWSLTLGAQQPAQKAPPAPPAPPAAPAAPAPPAPPRPDLEEGGQAINIRLDVTVTDQTVQGLTQPKSLMVMLVDRAMGRTRVAFENRSINVDARPTITDGHIRVYLTIQSDGHFEPGTQRDNTLNWRNSFSLLLDNGKPMLALETNDAATKRKMSIEVKATIQK